MFIIIVSKYTTDKLITFSLLHISRTTMFYHYQQIHLCFKSNNRMSRWRHWKANLVCNRSADRDKPFLSPHSINSMAQVSYRHWEPLRVTFILLSPRSKMSVKQENVFLKSRFSILIWIFNTKIVVSGDISGWPLWGTENQTFLSTLSKVVRCSKGPFK